MCVGPGERRMKYLLLATVLLTACGENDMFIAKSVANTKQQHADIEARICRHDANDCYLPFHALNVVGGTQVAVVDALPGEAKYAGCGGCHGSQGGGGVGPALAGKTVEYIVGRLNQYKAGEKVGNQSNMMWGQAAGLSDQDINDLAEYVVSL